METAHIQSMICEWSAHFIQPLVACAPRRSRFFSIMAILAWAMHFERFWNFVTPYCNCEQYVLFVWSSFGPFSVHVDGTEQQNSEKKMKRWKVFLLWVHRVLLINIWDNILSMQGHICLYNAMSSIDLNFWYSEY